MAGTVEENIIMAFVLGIIYMLVMGAVCFSMAVLLLRGKEEKYNRIFLVCQGLAVLWCSSQVLILLADTKNELIAAYLLGNLVICFIGVFWYYFAVLYTGRECHKVRRYLPV